MRCIITLPPSELVKIKSRFLVGSMTIRLHRPALAYHFSYKSFNLLESASKYYIEQLRSAKSGVNSNTFSIFCQIMAGDTFTSYADVLDVSGSPTVILHVLMSTLDEMHRCIEDMLDSNPRSN
jgi:hypothetical protein